MSMMGTSCFYLVFVLVVVAMIAMVEAIPAASAHSKDITRCFSVTEDGSEQLCLVVIQNSHCHALLNNATCSSCTTTYPHSCKDSSKLYKDFGYHVDCSLGNLHPEYADLRVCDGVVEVGNHVAPSDEHRREVTMSQMSKTMWIVGAVLVLGFLKCNQDVRERNGLVFKSIRRLTNPASNNTEDYNQVNAVDGLELVSEFEPPSLPETVASSADQTA